MIAPLRRPVENDEHEPYLDFLNWIFTGADGRFPEMNAQQRIDWMRAQLPQTYARLSLSRRWPFAS
jgi:hypothetical protein